MSYYFTNAPESYDYSYVETVKTIKLIKGRTWRLIKVSDEVRFANYQQHRYSSGLFQAYKPGSEWSNYLGLPKTAEECLATLTRIERAMVDVCLDEGCGADEPCSDNNICIFAKKYANAAEAVFKKGKSNANS